MRLSRQARLQLVVFAAFSVLALAAMGLHFMKLPAKLFGVGRYTVAVELPRTGGLYNTSNVTYRGSEVGRVESIHLTDSGVSAKLSLKSGIAIPSDLAAEVHSQSAIGEQYVELRPRSDTAPPLRNGDVIPLRNTSVPPDINSLLDAVNIGLRSVPRDSLKTVIDESYTAVGGLGPELSQLVKGVTDISIGARDNLESLLALIDQARPVLDSQSETSDAIQSWAANLAGITHQLQTHHEAVAGILETGGSAMDDARALVDQLRPTLPIVLANLANVSGVALTYHANLEQLLVLVPQLVAVESAGLVANHNTKQDYQGQYLSFNLNLNLPAPCTTGYLPAQQQRNPALEDYPERPDGTLYCRVPQDGIVAVRGARNTPCVTRPGKRAPTVKWCESDQEYVPLNDGFNWKGDPNATLTGQDVPDTGPPPAPLAVVPYDPLTGSYIGPDGRRYTQTDLARSGPEEKTWRAMLMPPGI